MQSFRNDAARRITPCGVLLAMVYALAIVACAPQVEHHTPRRAGVTDATLGAKPGMLRILMLPPSATLPSTGGERNMDFFARGLHGLAYDVHVLTPAGPLARHYRDLGVATGAPETLRLLGRNATDFEVVGSETTTRIAEALRCANAGTCTAEQGLQPLVPLLAKLDAMLLPSNLAEPSGEVVTLDELNLPAQLKQALVLRRAAQQARADVVFADLSRDAATAVVGLAGTHMHVLWYPQMTEPEPSDSFLVLHTTVVTCGEGVRRHRFSGAPHVVAVPNGVDMTRFARLAPHTPRPALLQHGSEHALIIGHVASVDGRKNQKLLIQAVGERIGALGDVQLYFFGDINDSAYKHSAVALAQSMGIADLVHFVGNHADIEAYIPHFDLFVLPSLAEGMPLSLLEAMSAEVACLASDIPGTQEMAGDGVAYFPPDDARVLGDKIVDLAGKPALRQKMGAAARATVLERNFTTDAMLHKMAEQVDGAANR